MGLFVHYTTKKFTSALIIATSIFVLPMCTKTVENKKHDYNSHYNTWLKMISGGKIYPATHLTDDKNEVFKIHSGATDYIIGPTDVLEITVCFGDRERTYVREVPPDGIIAFYLINPVKVDGKSVSELRTLFEEILREYIRNPIVSVRIKEYRSKKVFILGGVTCQQKEKSDYLCTYILRGKTTLRDLIFDFGGFMSKVDLNNMYLIRKNKAYRVNMNSTLFLHGQESCNPILDNKDILIVVPKFDH